jgi:hypothetical protein
VLLVLVVKARGWLSLTWRNNGSNQ